VDGEPVAGQFERQLNLVLVVAVQPLQAAVEQTVVGILRAV
jgi:hypothetical protein